LVSWTRRNVDLRSRVRYASDRPRVPSLPRLGHLRAPLGFAYSWCTDFSPEDPKLAEEDRSIHLQRRIVDRTPRRVVFENVYDEGKGWAWEQHTVTLTPPDRWHSDGFGLYHESHLDYRLFELDPVRTRFEMDWTSKPSPRSTGRRPTKKGIEKFVTGLWRRRGRSLERDYRRSRGR
jgi:hypothetical protein